MAYLRQYLSNLPDLSLCSAFSQYNKDQLTPARVEGSELPCLVTDYNDAGGGRFQDPRSRQTFRYDHLRKEASDAQPWAGPAEAALSGLESLRQAVEVEATAYALDHYKHGACSVFAAQSADGPAVVVCIEDHQFQPKNYWYAAPARLFNFDFDFSALSFPRKKSNVYLKQYSRL